VDVEGGDPKQVEMFGGFSAMVLNLGLEVKRWKEIKCSARE